MKLTVCLFFLISVSGFNFLRQSESGAQSRNSEDRYQDPVMTKDAGYSSTEEKDKKRAEAVATMHAQRAQPGSQFFPIAIVDDEETYPGWEIFQVMLQADSEFHILKVCLPDDEEVLPFVLEKGDLCSTEIDATKADEGGEETVEDEVQSAIKRVTQLTEILQRVLKDVSSSSKPIYPSPRPESKSKSTRQVTWAN